MKSINITLPNEQFLFINELLKFGKYKNESEIISDALNIMERMHFDKKEELKRRYEEILKISENLPQEKYDIEEFTAKTRLRWNNEVSD